MSLRMFEAVPHVLSYLAEPGSYAHLSLRVRLGRLCPQAQAVWRGDGCRAERDEVERQEDELPRPGGRGGRGGGAMVADGDGVRRPFRALGRRRLRRRLRIFLFYIVLVAMANGTRSSTRPQTVATIAANNH